MPELLVQQRRLALGHLTACTAARGALGSALASWRRSCAGSAPSTSCQHASTWRQQRTTGSREAIHHVGVRAFAKLQAGVLNKACNAPHCVQGPSLTTTPQAIDALCGGGPAHNRGTLFAHCENVKFTVPVEVAIIRSSARCMGHAALPMARTAAASASTAAGVARTGFCSQVQQAFRYLIKARKIKKSLVQGARLHRQGCGAGV